MMNQPFPIKMDKTRGFHGRRQVNAYFEELTHQYHRGDLPCLFLPSLLQLSELLGCSTLDIQCALIELRRHGADFFMMDIHGPITLWFPSKMALFSEEQE